MRSGACSRLLTVALLTSLSFLIGVDRYSVAGLLSQISGYYDVSDSWAGLIGTLYTLVYLLSAPLIGFLSDRYPRKRVCVAFCLAWLVGVVGSSFVPRNAFWLFLALRALAGTGYSAVNTIAPPLISQLFSHDGGRSYALMLFCYAIPFGWSAAMIVTAEVESSEMEWQWGLRFVPPLAFIVLILFTFFAQVNGFSGKTFWLMTSTVTCVNAVMGAQSWWNPTLLLLARNSTSLDDSIYHGQGYALIQTITGVENTLGGVLGTTIAVSIAERWHTSGLLWLPPSSNSFSLVGGLGTLLATPSTLYVQHLYLVDINWNYVFGFFGSLMSFGTFALTIHNIMRVIPSNRRSTAMALYYIVGSLLGDAPSPYIVGKIADALLPHQPSPVSSTARLSSLLSAFYFTNSMMGVASIGFFLSVLTMRSDIAQEPSRNSSKTQQREILTSPLNGNELLSSEREH